MATLLDQARQAGRTVMRNACVTRARFPSIVGPAPMQGLFTQVIGEAAAIGERTLGASAVAPGRRMS